MKIIPLNRFDIFASNSYLLISDDALAVIDPSVGYDDAVCKYPEIADKNKKTVLLDPVEEVPLSDCKYQQPFEC